MEVIADIKITTKDGRVLFDEKRIFESISDITSFGDDIIQTERLDLQFNWINKEVDLL